MQIVKLQYIGMCTTYMLFSELSTSIDHNYNNIITNIYTV